jgi:hypothetical protein
MIWRLYNMKMNWKKAFYCLLTFVLLGCIGGCTTEHLDDKSLPSAISAQRSLPKTYVPGEPVKVILDLDVLPDKAPNGVIVRDVVPPGWTVKSAVPKYNNWDPGTGQVSWVFKSGQVSDTGMDITYTVSVPPGESDAKIFSGEILYNDPDSGDPMTIDITGDTDIP